MLYVYKAIKDNRVETKKIEAESEETVVKFLKEKGLVPIEIKPAQQSGLTIFDKVFNRVSFNDVVDLTRQLAIMLNAGLTIVDSLEILKKQIAKESLRKMIEDIDRQIKGGTPLSTALSAYPQYFPNLYIALVKSGEASGKLSEILLKLSENLEKQREFNGKLKGALIYPVIVVSAMIIVMFIMITFVVPRLLALYKDFNIDLPLSTKILITVSSFMSQFWIIVVALVAGLIVLFKRYRATKQGKHVFDTLSLRVPVISGVLKKAALVDSTRTLAILSGAGVSILDALSIVIETTGNSVYQEAFQNIYKNVEKGQSLGSALGAEGIFPPILVQMTIVGENTGHLDDTLFRLSRYFEMESELAIKAMTTLIEPLILVVLGVGVGFIVISVISPIYTLTSSFK